MLQLTGNTLLKKKSNAYIGHTITNIYRHLTCHLSDNTPIKHHITKQNNKKLDKYLPMTQVLSR